MANEFKCPACSAPMEFDGGDSIFQTCKKCHAPIVVPSDVYYSKEQQIDAEDFATLTNDKTVSKEQVSLDVGAGEVASDDKIEEMIGNPKNGEFAVQNGAENFSSENIGATVSENVQPATAKTPSEAQLSQLNYLINQGRKIEAIRFYRGIYDCDPEIAKTEVEEMLEKRAAELRKRDPNTPLSSDSIDSILARIENEIAGGNKISAIKLFLDSFNTSLAESKEVVDAMQSGKKVDVSGFERR